MTYKPAKAAPRAAVTNAPGLDTSGAANIPAATEFAPSGAPVQTTDIDASHPAVDDNPRRDTTVDQNRIDFNDPTLTSQEAVEQNLAAQKGE
jgi:hypothetical protein